MRVISVTLERFGALRGRYNLDPKLTVIVGPNESGKSTLHTALRVALAGVELPSRGRMPKGTEQVLRRFRPWKGKSFTVQAEVELEGGRYRFVRDLDQPDSCVVEDLIRGGDVTDHFRRGRNVDVAVPLGMGREAFLAVSTVAQDQILDISASSLQSDLQRATATSGAGSTVSAAIEALRAWRQEHLRTDRSTNRPLDQAVRELDDTRGLLARAKEARSRLAEELTSRDELRAREAAAAQAAAVAEGTWKAAELAELDQDLIAIEEIDSSLSQLPEAEAPANAAAIREAAEGAPQLAAQLREAETKVSEHTPKDPSQAVLADRLSVSELNFLADALERPVPPLPAQAGGAARLELLDRRAVALHRWSSDLIATLGGVAGVLLIWNAVSAKVDSFSVELFVGGLLVMVVAFSAFLFLQRRLRRLLAVGGFASVAEMRKAKRSQDPEVLKAVAAQEEVLAQRAKARTRVAELGIGHLSAEQMRQVARELPPLQEALRQLASWTSTRDRAREQLQQRAAAAGVDEPDPFKAADRLVEMAREVGAAVEAARRRSELQVRRDERLNGRDLRALVTRAEELRAEVGGMMRQGLIPKTGRPSSELRLEYDQRRKELETVRAERLPLEGRLEQELRTAGDLVELEERVKELEAKVARMTFAEDAVKLAIEQLERAEGEIHNSLAPVLAQGLESRLPKLTHRRYQRAWVDPADLSMHVAAANTERQIPVENLSQGTQEQIYVCLRMVLAQALSPRGEALPLFFDDPTVNSDDHRCFALLDTLLELCETSQVVIFSHERRVVEWAQRKGVAVLQLEAVPASADEAPAASSEG